MCRRALDLRRCFPIVRPTLSVVRSIPYLLQYWGSFPVAVLYHQVRSRLTMSSDKGRQERAGAAFPRVLGLREAIVKAVGRERSAKKVLEGASRLGTYALLRLTALRLRESRDCGRKAHFENPKF